MTSNFQQFEQYLNDYSYVSGYLLSTLDVDLCFALQKVHIDKNKLPNTYRWFNHVKNFYGVLVQYRCHGYERQCVCREISDEISLN